MSIFGLGNSADDEQAKNKSGKKTKTSTKMDEKSLSKKTKSSQADEAQALLEKMSAKSDAGECPFC